MRCLLCQNWSLPIICHRCRETLLVPELNRRVLDDGLSVYSFYRYQEIAPLLKTKHTYLGYRIYTLLARQAFTLFTKRFQFDVTVGIVPVDGIPKGDYAHTAILAKALETKYLRACYRALPARYDVTYSAKSREYRKNHPRGFIFQGKCTEKVILVDDIVTTGTTLMEAARAVEAGGAKALFALTLANASDL